MRHIILSIIIIFTANAIFASTPKPNVYAVCVGAALPLTNEAHGGIWKSANEKVASVDPVTGNVQGWSSGTVLIIYEINGQVVSRTAVTVYPIAQAIIGESYVCAGKAITLTSAEGGTWASSDEKVATITADGELAGNEKGSATISYSFGGTCVSTKNITVEECRRRGR